MATLRRDSLRKPRNRDANLGIVLESKVVLEHFLLAMFLEPFKIEQQHTGNSGQGLKVNLAQRE